MEGRRDAQAQPLHPLGFLQHADDGGVQVGLEHTLHPREQGALQEGGGTPQVSPYMALEVWPVGGDPRTCMFLWPTSMIFTQPW